MKTRPSTEGILIKSWWFKDKLPQVYQHRLQLKDSTTNTVRKINVEDGGVSAVTGLTLSAE